MTNDRSLYEETSVDVTPPSNPAGFDFSAWLAGWRPVRRAVKLYSKAHLIADVERLLDEGDEPGAQAVWDEFEASGAWIILEQRSQEWQTKFRRNLAHEKGWRLDGDDDPLEVEQRREVNLRQLAEQIAEPPITYEQLEQMRLVNENEVAKLIVAMNLANRQLAESPDFSRRLSDTSRTSTDS